MTGRILSAANALAMALPIPRAPPVTIAILRLFSMAISCCRS
jgi:hypothetical protein